MVFFECDVCFPRPRHECEVYGTEVVMCVNESLGDDK